MSLAALRSNCFRCPYYAKRREGALEPPHAPCPQDRYGRVITPDRVKRSQPVGWVCSTLKGGA